MIRFVENRAAVSFRKMLAALFMAAFTFVASGIACEASGGSPASAFLESSDSPTITYRKIFKSSYPEFVEIKLDGSGHGTFDIRQLDETAAPQP